MKDDEKKKHSNEDLEWIYQETFGHAVEFMRDFDVQAVAATYMAIAMRLYKTHLDKRIRITEPSLAKDGIHYGVEHHKLFDELFLKKFCRNLK